MFSSIFFHSQMYSNIHFVVEKKTCPIVSATRVSSSPHFPLFLFASFLFYCSQTFSNTHFLIEKKTCLVIAPTRVSSFRHFTLFLFTASFLFIWSYSIWFCFYTLPFSFALVFLGMEVPAVARPLKSKAVKMLCKPGNTTPAHRAWIAHGIMLLASSRDAICGSTLLHITQNCRHIAN